jgi:hypothetical protein
MRLRRSLCAPAAAAAALAALWFAGPAVAAAATSSHAAPQVHVELQPERITVGDPVAVTLRLESPPGSADRPVSFPGLGESWGDAVVLSPPTEVAPAGGGAAGASPVRVWRMRVTAYRTGKVPLPPLRVELGGDPPTELSTPDGLALEVTSVLTGDARSQHPEPPAPPRPLPVPAAFWWTAAGFAAAVAAAALLLARRRRDEDTMIAPAAPLAELERALGGLAADPVAAHAGLSLALRRYLGRRVGFPALESTTTEVARGLGARGLDPAIPRRARRLLGECDGVKFALHDATAEQLAARRDEARALALEVEAATAPVEATGP